MKNILILLTLLVTHLTLANDRNIIVALNLNDCANCTISLYNLYQKLDKPKITFIFKSNLEIDSLLVNKRTGLLNYKECEVIYSDNLFNKYINGLNSTINIVENEKILFSTPLLGMDINLFMNNYLNNIQLNCFDELKRGSPRIQFDNSLLIFNSELFRWSYYDKVTNFDIIPNNQWVKLAYQIYYKNSYEKYFHEYENAVKILPSINPTIYNISKFNSSELLLIVDINLPLIDELKNINFIKKQFTIIYDINNQKISDIKFINTEHLLLKDKYKVVNSSFIFPINDNFIIPLNTKNGNPNTESKYLSVFEINKNNQNEIILKHLMDQSIPKNYIKYKLFNNLHSYCFHKSLILLKYSEHIYDFNKNKTYKIPFEQETFDKLENIVSNLGNGKMDLAYYIFDIFDKNETILLLYKDSSKNLKLMEIDKKSEKALFDKQLISGSNLESYTNKSSFILNEMGQVCYLNNENCITTL
ncbi:hypothetical protein P3875_06340 [Myroides sp. JBRI-B21084]|uniref:hypothetical protein n=1 Tax=Myroides sp. JBRI-B21084 TaxID=3119977 RepID=UPI0026E3D138|nr:hypothetical protein [Paenimyroides cloacae]WKW45405.1 hypothetical protein P3875_06340 [Paenimyroides cloacae]